jgi:6-pyruvoyltetrahydropterin/6-carboxytetrahydropterin synthase
MIVALTRQARFSAGHRYYRPDWNEAENRERFGDNALPFGHGHDYVVEATVEGELNVPVGMVINITELKAALLKTLEPLDGQFLDYRHSLFENRIPTTENLSKVIWDGLLPQLQGCRLTQVRVYESSSLWSDYYGRDEAVELTRKYEFSAAHRLHSPALSDEDNREIFGKCNHLYGHGHNYEVDVTVSGPIHPETGMVADLARLDRVVHERVVDRMDHRHLNHEIPEFEGVNPTSENLAVVVWNLLKPELGDALVKVGIQETERNYFEYRGS